MATQIHHHAYGPPKGSSRSRPLGHDAPHDSFSTPLARHVLFPPLKFDFEGPKIEGTISAADMIWQYEISVAGDIVVQRKGFMENVAFSKDEIEAELKPEAEKAFQGLGQVSHIKFDPLKREFSLSAGFTGGEYWTAEFASPPPGWMLKFVFSPKEIELERDDFAFKGGVGYEALLRGYRRDQRDPVPVFVPVPDYQPAPHRVQSNLLTGAVIAVAVVAIAAVAIALTIPTGGTSDGVGYAAAAALVAAF